MLESVMMMSMVERVDGGGGKFGDSDNIDHFCEIIPVGNHWLCFGIKFDLWWGSNTFYQWNAGQACIDIMGHESMGQLVALNSMAHQQT